MRAFTYLAQLRNRPTAIVCSNDMTAVGVIRRSYELGFAVPQELSVIGLDDIPLARFISPPLTTVRVPQAELARLAFHALISGIGSSGARDRQTERVRAKYDLVLRRSTALALPRGSNPTNLQSSIVESSTEDPLMQRAGRNRWRLPDCERTQECRPCSVGRHGCCRGELKNVIRRRNWMAKVRHHRLARHFLILCLVAGTMSATEQTTFAPSKMGTVLYGVAYYRNTCPTTGSTKMSR